MPASTPLFSPSAPAAHWWQLGKSSLISQRQRSPLSIPLVAAMASLVLSVVVGADVLPPGVTWQMRLASPRSWVRPRRYPLVRKPPTLTRTTLVLRSLMLNRGLIIPQLDEALSYLRHTDSVVFADGGLP